MSEHPFLTEDHEQVRALARDFADREVRPVARHHDLHSEFPWENVKKMSELGLLGAPWPEDLGGAGMDGRKRKRSPPWRGAAFRRLP